MGIRFFIPLPGPFFYTPGRKYPKLEPSAYQLATVDLAARNIANLHRVAYAVAVECSYPNPASYADTVVNRTSGERSLWGAIGVIIGLAALMIAAGPGVVLLGLIPVIGLPVLALISVPGVILALAMSRRSRVLRIVAREFGIIPESGRHRR